MDDIESKDNLLVTNILTSKMNKRNFVINTTTGVGSNFRQTVEKYICLYNKTEQ